MTTPEKSVEEIEKVKEIARDILQVIVSEWPEYNIMTGRERNALFDGIKPIITQTIQTERQKREEVVEALEAITKMCDGNNPAHEEIWHTAYEALQALNQPNNNK